MNVLPLLQSLPHVLAAIRPDDGQLAFLAVFGGMGLSIKMSMLRKQAKVRREKFIREREALKQTHFQRDNEHR